MSRTEQITITEKYRTATSQLTIETAESAASEYEATSIFLCPMAPPPDLDLRDLVGRSGGSWSSCSEIDARLWIWMGGVSSSTAPLAVCGGSSSETESE